MMNPQDRVGRLKIPMKDRICANCGSKTTYMKYHKQMKKYYPSWHSVNGECWCFGCFNREIHAPKWGPINNPKYNKIYRPRQLQYKNKVITFKEKPRKGICQRCNKKIGDTYIDYYGKLNTVKQTQLHHIEYHDDDPLKDTIEVCVSCHMKIEIQKRRELILNKGVKI